MSRDDAWIQRRVRRPSSRCRLFCFPYAGGSAQMYWEWSDALPDDVEVCAIQLPGRGPRFRETPVDDVGVAVSVLAAAVRPYLDRPFAMFGHSMGAILAYETARRVTAEFGSAPDHLFISGHRAPHLPPRRPSIHQLADEAFIAGVRALNGTPAEFFDDPELVTLCLSMLRADFRLVESYAELAGERLSCPLLALGGDLDPTVPAADLAAWRSATSGPFRSILFPGDHFYVRTARTSLIACLRHELARRIGT
jgi:medium-chain acyl-[acyl-carrier-protein] hydrolase